MVYSLSDDQRGALDRAVRSIHRILSETAPDLLDYFSALVDDLDHEDELIKSHAAKMMNIVLAAYTVGLEKGVKIGEIKAKSS